MNFDTLILELLTRIQQLERENAQIQIRLSALEANSLSSIDVTSSAAEEESSGHATRRTNITEEMIDICYRYGKMVYTDPTLEIRTVAESAAAETGMNYSSAIMYIYAVACMLKGVVYKRAISRKATEIYLHCIRSDYGTDGLARALAALRRHIEYCQNLGYKVDGLSTLYNAYQSYD